MAQTGYTPILIYASGTASAVPSAANMTSSASGAELALNYVDGKLYYKNSGGTVTLLASAAGASGDVVGPASATDNALARFDGTTGKLIQNSVGVLSDAGVLTGLTGLTSSGSITFSSLTSGRVPYATTAGLLTDSANLLYSGTDLTVYGITVGRGAGAVSSNTAVGASALAANTTGSGITALGYQSGNANTTGVNNVFVGGQAGAGNTTGNNNVAIGVQAFQVNTTASDSVFIGSVAGYNCTAGSNLGIGASALRNATGGTNIAIGNNAMYNSTSVSGTVAVGYESMKTNTISTNNTALGYQSLFSNTTASSGTAVGYQAGYTATTTGLGVYVGYQAGYTNNGANFTAVGYQAGYANTSGANTTALGLYALRANTTGDSNTAVGSTALQTNTTGAYNVAVGTLALQANTTASNSTAVGYQAAYSSTTGGQNVAIGQAALYTNQTGNFCVAVGNGAGALSTNGGITAIGNYALNVNSTGIANVAVGGRVDSVTLGTLVSNTSGSYNTGIGSGALARNTTASGNTAVGYQSGYSNTTGANINAFGNGALYTSTTGANNSAFGTNALYSNTTGGNNTALGNNALNFNTTASNNTAVGYQAGYSGTVGGYSTHIGYQAGYASNFTSDSFANNTFVGALSGSAITTGRKNTILGLYTGNQGGLDIRTASNYIVLSDGDGNPRFVVNGSGYAGLRDATIGTTALTLRAISNTYIGGALALQDAAGTSKMYLSTISNQLFIGDNASADCSVINQYGIGLGATPPTSGMGIAFPATQSASSNANTLDDYEEGSWSPTFTGTTTNPTIGTYGNTWGTYVKVGSMVTVQFYITCSSISSVGSGNLYIAGLPFATLSQGGTGYVGGSVGYAYSSNTGTDKPAALLANPGATSTRIYAFSGSAANTSNLSVQVTCSGFLASGCEIYGTLTYKTT